MNEHQRNKGSNVLLGAAELLSIVLISHFHPKVQSVSAHRDHICTATCPFRLLSVDRKLEVEKCISMAKSRCLSIVWRQSPPYVGESVMGGSTV